MNKKMFFLIEAVLATMIIALTFVVFQEKNEKEREKVSVVVQNTNDNQWAAFKYGLEMAARDHNIEIFFVSTEGTLTAEEEIKIVKEEINRGADAVILQPVFGEDTEEMLAKLQKKIPIMMIEQAADAAEEERTLAVTEPDNYAMGKTLAEELRKDYNGNLEGKTIGILAGTKESAAVKAREQGVREALEGSGAKIPWAVYGSRAESAEIHSQLQSEVDVVIALDNTGLITAGEYSASNDLRGAVLYGIGSSTEAVYYLDTGRVECLIIPDMFSVGYQSLVETAAKMKDPFYKMKSDMVLHTAVRRETLFSKENQEILYTMSQ